MLTNDHLFFLIVLWNLFIMVDCEPKSGACLSYAQYACIPESSELVDVQFTQPANTQLMCSKFLSLHLCIKDAVQLCDYTTEQEEFYKLRYQDLFTSSPYNCRNIPSSSGWGKGSAERHVSSSSRQLRFGTPILFIYIMYRMTAEIVL